MPQIFIRKVFKMNLSKFHTDYNVYHIETFNSFNFKLLDHICKGSHFKHLLRMGSLT